MWALIFGSMLIGALLSAIYLAGRFAKFLAGTRFEQNRKIFRLGLGCIPVVLIALVLKLILGTTTTMICLIHLTIFWLLCDGVQWLIRRKRKRNFKRYYAGFFAIGITVVYLTVGWYMAHHVWRTDYTLISDKDVDNLRIVQIADSHVGTTFDGEGFAEQVKAMQSENPDIVVITGDYVDDSTSKEDMIAACKALGTLKTTYGVYYAFGNHDKGYYPSELRGYTGEDLISELEKNNVKVLQDETVLLDDRYYVIGRQDRSEEQKGGSRDSMEQLVSGLDKEKYMIVLDHQPHDYNAQAASGVDLVLSGHTHGGQLFPVNYVGEWTGENDKTYGWEKRNNTNFIVTSGISDWEIPFKTGCKSEYVVIDIKKRGQS